MLEAAEGIFCLRLNEAEAAWLVPDADGPATAAEELAARGARTVVVTLGAGGALARGAASAEAPGVDVDVVSPLGAGDAFMGALGAGFAKRGWVPEAVGEALGEANAAGPGPVRNGGPFRDRGPHHSMLGAKRSPLI